MLYCEHCMLLSNDECPRCGSGGLREPQANDPVYILTRDALWAGGIEEMLAKNGIPCLKRGQKGAGIIANVGYMNETFDFYVPFGALEQAQALIES